ncbi:MAG: hypothetical protein ACI97A_004115 [Planctomycetota bacterium]
MLFSDKRIAATINSKFEAVWQSLRPVPMVTVDFGNGIVLHRTLHGNIATFVCNGGGNVLDVLPGIYAPEAYDEHLTRLSQVHGKMTMRYGANPGAKVLSAYHQETLNRITRLPTAVTSSFLAPRTVNPAHDLLGAKANDLASWAALQRDTEINEGIRRVKIHRKLAKLGSVRPRDITKWLYREILDADLDDPYMGLREALIDSHPNK